MIILAGEANRARLDNYQSMPDTGLKIAFMGGRLISIDGFDADSLERSAQALASAPIEDDPLYWIKDVNPIYSARAEIRAALRSALPDAVFFSIYPLSCTELEREYSNFFS